MEEEAELKAQQQRDKIRKEHEEAEARRQLIKEQKKRAEEEILRNHQIRLEEIQGYLSGTINELPQSLIGTTESNPGRDECQFHKKTAMCRFGDKCSRNHIKSKFSQILIVANFFRSESFLRSHSLTTSEDIIQNSLEVNRDFNEFFEDICQELERFGEIRNLVVCSNSERHMIGNTIVEYQGEKYVKPGETIKEFIN